MARQTKNGARRLNRMAKLTMNGVNNGRTPLELSQISFEAVKKYENILSFEVKIKNVQRGINKKQQAILTVFIFLFKMKSQSIPKTSKQFYM